MSLHGILKRCLCKLQFHVCGRRFSEALPVAVDLSNADGRNTAGKQQRQNINVDTKLRPLMPFSSSSKKEIAVMSEEDESRINALLSQEQKDLVKKMLLGHNIYFTGKAGTGKSLVIKKFVNEFSKVHPKKKLAVVAPTGIAASLINGQTFHSFLGFPVFFDRLDDQKFKALMENIRRTPWKKKAYTKTDVLVIDEASMLHPLLFDMLNILMKELRGKETRHLPFGGLQVIISGDFFQLPPVVNRNSRNSYHSKDIGSHTVVNSSIFREEGNIPYLFDSRAWAELIHSNMQTIELTNVFRQTDPVFLDILEEMRMGDCTAQTWEILNGCKSKQWPSDGIMPTQISAFRVDADRRNSSELDSLLSGPMKTFESVDFLRTDNGLAKSEILLQTHHTNTVDSHFESFQPSRVLSLKRFAQVILIRNLSLEDGLVNGSKGFIVDFIDAYDPLSGRILNLPLVQFAHGSQYVIGYVEFTSPFKTEDTYLVRRQIPLKLGWALTIHKSQGMTLDRVDIDIPQAFAPGHAYVAVSRVKNLSGLRLLNFSSSSLILNRKVYSFYSSIFSQQKALARSHL